MTSEERALYSELCAIGERTKGKYGNDYCWIIYPENDIAGYNENTRELIWALDRKFILHADFTYRGGQRVRCTKITIGQADYNTYLRDYA